MTSGTTGIGRVAATGGAPAAARRGSWLAAAGVLALLLVVELIGRFGLAGPSWPPLSAVLGYLGTPTARLVLGRAIGATGTAAALGFGLGAVLGVALATLGTLLPPIGPGLDRLAAVVNAIPLIALGPLLINTAGRAAPRRWSPRWPPASRCSSRPPRRWRPPRPASETSSRCSAPGG